MEKCQRSSIPYNKEKLGGKRSPMNWKHGISKSCLQWTKKAYDGKTTTAFGALPDSFRSISYDNQKAKVDDHITEYERIWNAFVGIISRVNFTQDDGFGEGLKAFTKSDKATTQFLLRSFLQLYANTIENVKSKDLAYNDAVRWLREYIPARQKNKGRRGGTIDNPIVLKTDRKGATKDNSKQCEYCIANAWKGMNHTEGEYYTQKREEGKKKGKTKRV